MNLKLLLLFNLFICANLRGQVIDSFSYLKAKAPIPKILTQNLEERTEDLLRKYSDNEDLQDFVIGSSYSINIFLNSGQIIFNDDITTYLEDIAALILKDQPKLLNELQFFTLKSSVANAFATPQGLIFVTTGLLAQLESEAELAFIIAHEISHYTEEHGLDFHYEMGKIKTKKESLRRNSTSYDKDLIRHVHKYKKENEFEADLQGLELMSKTNYDLAAVENSFYTLLYSYLPIEERRFNKTLMTGNSLLIPDSIFFESYQEVTQVEDYDDSESTHPNIKKRIEKTTAQIEKLNHMGNQLYLISEERFTNTQTLARLSIINNFMVEKKYFRALYHLNMMEKDLKENYFMDLSELKLYYGMLCYMNAYEWDSLLEMEKNCEGELSYLVNYFSELSKEGLSTLAVYKIIEATKRYPKDPLVQEYFDLIAEETKTYCLLSHEDFLANEFKTDFLLNYEEDERERGDLEDYFITAFGQSDIDNFLPYFFDGGKDEVKDDLPSVKEGQYKRANSMYAKYPAGKMDKLMLINPQYVHYVKNKDIDLIKGAQNSTFLAENIEQLNENDDFRILDYRKLSEGNIEQYNQLGFTQMWMEDINSFSDKFSMRSCLKEKMLEIKAKHQIDQLSSFYMIRTAGYNPLFYKSSDLLILVNSALLYSHIFDAIVNRNTMLTFSTSYNIENSSIDYKYLKILKEPSNPYIIRSEINKFKNTLTKK